MATVFSKNRDHLLEGDIAAAFFDGVVEKIRAHGLLSDDPWLSGGCLPGNEANDRESCSRTY
ncbi:MAG TPA: hypothetical protein VHX49_05125 [Candidatus Acidoferrales bacterium]|nr:hypothetical protein [Candidatus Acidoferrales bacterium]